MAAGRENAWAKSLGSPLPGAPKRDTRRGANKREDKSTLQGDLAEQREAPNERLSVGSLLLKHPIRKK